MTPLKKNNENSDANNYALIIQPDLKANINGTTTT